MTLAQIHILKHQLGLADHRYREILRETVNADSAKGLSPSDLAKVIRAMKASASAKTPAARYIWVLWRELSAFLPSKDRGGAWLCGFLYRAGVTLEDLTCLDALPPSDKHKAIEALKIRINYETTRSASVPF